MVLDGRPSSSGQSPPMYRLPAVVPIALVVIALSACGPADPVEVCGLSGAAPTADDVRDGFGRAERDGQPFEEAGSWGAAPQASIDIGTLSLTVPYDETGTEVTDLIARRAFPICVRLGERSDTVGAGNLVDGGYITDAGHTGAVAILGEEGGLLLGRFAVELISSSEGAETSFTDGAFRLERR